MSQSLKMWNYFQSVIDENDLLHISEADCGYDQKQHLQEINKILNSKTLPPILKWEPKEVLELVKWEEYGSNDNTVLNRVFFCSFVLLVAAEQSEDMWYYLNGVPENIIIAIDTAYLLGKEQLEYLLEFFEYALPNLDINVCEEDLLYFYLGTYIVASLLNQPEDKINTLINKIIVAEKEVQEKIKEYFHEDIMKYTFFDQKIALWYKYLSEHGDKIQKIRLTKRSRGTA